MRSLSSDVPSGGWPPAASVISLGIISAYGTAAPPNLMFGFCFSNISVNCWKPPVQRTPVKKCWKLSVTTWPPLVAGLAAGVLAPAAAAVVAAAVGAAAAPVVAGFVA